MADLSPETRDAVREGCKRSAATVLPLVFDYLGVPDALLDVGAGEGWWIDEAHRLGVRQAGGVDVAPTREIVSTWDAELAEPLPMRLLPSTEREATYGRWPLALCLEMAEHVSPQSGDHLVSELTRVADIVLWSAAIPGQGGDGHVNEQWPDYWHARFEENNYALMDHFRDRLWGNPDVEPWYRHGILLGLPWPQRQKRDHIKAPRALVDPVTWAHHRGVPAPSA